MAANSETAIVRYLNRLLILLSFIAVTVAMPQPCGAAVRRLSGTVVDGTTGEPLPYAVFRSKGKPRGQVLGDTEGRLVLSPLPGQGHWILTYTGFEDKEVDTDTLPDGFVLRMNPVAVTLDEVTVKPGKLKYSKRNNPAVEFVNRLRKSSRMHDPTQSPYYSYDKYEKTVVGINHYDTGEEGRKQGRRKEMLRAYADTSAVTGNTVLNLMIKERASTRITADNRRIDKEVVRGRKSSGMDETIDQANMALILEDAFRETDIFGNSITMLQNRLVSPLSGIGPDFYKYWLTDTVDVGGTKCVELSFAPHNPETMGFNGRIYIVAGDTAMPIRKVTMRTPADINLNYVDNMFVNQSFETDSLGNRHKTYDDLVVEFSLKSGSPGVYARKTTVYDNFSYEKRNDLSEKYGKLGKWLELDGARVRDDGFWNAERMVPLSAAESRMEGMMPALRRDKLFYWGEKFLALMESGYVRTGRPSKIDLGPVNTLLSFNSVEGVRLRLGAMTMAPLNPYLFAKGYAAYGIKDHKWKYNAHLEYSFSRKERHGYEWPRHGFYVEKGYDLDMIGQHYLHTNADNVFLSPKHKQSSLVTYRDRIRGGYILELRNNFSVEATVNTERQDATRWLPFVTGDGIRMDHYRQSAFGLKLRWAPGEKFVQGRTTRKPVNMDAWIFSISHEYGPKGLFGASFTLNRTELAVGKRLWFSAFGYADIQLKGGAIWDAVYFPALMWPNANLSFTIQPDSYSLMDAMEFANDRYAALDVTYFGNGVIFNHLPLLRKLKLREVFTFKGLKGTLTRRNNPEYNKSLLCFPEDAHARVMGKTPYMEIGVGLDNILTVLRVDYVWRLTYLDTPGIDKSGVRVALHFSF